MDRVLINLLYLLILTVSTLLAQPEGWHVCLCTSICITLIYQCVIKYHPLCYSIEAC